MIVLKLGGSLITAKDRPETLDGPALDDAADAVADAVTDALATGGRPTLVLVHGGGSFGHHQAERHGVSETDGTSDAAAILDVHGAMTTLNRFVLSRLQERDVPALPVHPLSVGARRDGVVDDVVNDGDVVNDDQSDATLSLPLEATQTMVEEGFVPVLHGDVIAHAGRGATVVSGDELVVRLATELDADRVGLCSTVPGVLDEDGEVIPEIRAFEDVAGAVDGSDATDVTGGMAGKVRALLELDVPAHVFDSDGLRAFLGGDAPGTRIE